MSEHDVGVTADVTVGVASGVRVRTHPSLCTGFGNCHRWAPHVYPLDEDGCVDIHLLDVPAELAAEARLGAQVCPQLAITVIEHARSVTP